jgi:glycosyltransferase involved in cell wall biosynthesis
LLGLWVKRLVDHCAPACESKVISPVPFCPPGIGFSSVARFRAVEPRRHEGTAEVFHPRFLVGPGRSLYVSEAITYYLGVRALADRLQNRHSFDLIHAHFTYPDGVVAARLGRRYGLPLIITEHAPWRPNWIDVSPLVRRQAVWAAGAAAFHIAVSRSVHKTIAEFTGTDARIRVVPIGVDPSLFTPSTNHRHTAPPNVLFVGLINYNKGIDVLLRAWRRVRESRPDARLTLVGGSFYRSTQRQENELRGMAATLGCHDVTFLGPRRPEEVARLMRESSLLVLPSHAESFGAVLVEALASGVPVVATECGGPEDIVVDGVGRMVRPGDPDALAEAIVGVLGNRAAYDPQRLRSYALEKFAWERVAERIVALYREALTSHPRPPAAA